MENKENNVRNEGMFFSRKSEIKSPLGNINWYKITEDIINGEYVKLGVTNYKLKNFIDANSIYRDMVEIGYRCFDWKILTVSIFFTEDYQRYVIFCTEDDTPFVKEDKKDVEIRL